ncbi:MAG: hypothetical protein OQK94_02600 [Gammaproteobacteria bacterium]|nr:hypothetical protein [Gammaproteobacteria bacterium]MCW8841190.1 hypothetical protein [Gammaproteobacteria bacterium]MCW8957840.1 hypothetical protein [Gammaproteobacteria bacterium]MCW8973223.1 hypothetical protein [Gammaproteobacteria bacterium]MCW8991729.1 hypothetical protein [Gammaproteobacteria bacterium]
MPFILLLLSLASPVEALTLGDLVLRSAPGEPLQANIAVRLEPEESLGVLRVDVASPERYALQQLERPGLLQGLQIALLAKGEGHGQIQLFGEQPWRGEEAIVLLHIRWPQGEMERRFRIASQSSGETDSTPLYVEVAENESLDSIAVRLSKESNRSYMHMMVALYRANPSAFYRDNINNLKSGVRLRVPSEEELYQLSDAEVFSTVREHEARRTATRRAVQREQSEQRVLEQQLRQLAQENSEIEQRNRQLKERLARLEQQMSSMSRKVLDYQAPDQPKSAPTQSVPPSIVEGAKARGGEGLSVGWLLLLMAVVVAVVAAIWRFAPRQGAGE